MRSFRNQFCFEICRRRSKSSPFSFKFLNVFFFFFCLLFLEKISHFKANKSKFVFGRPSPFQLKILGFEICAPCFLMKGETNLEIYQIVKINSETKSIKDESSKKKAKKKEIKANNPLAKNHKFNALRGIPKRKKRWEATHERKK